MDWNSVTLEDLIDGLQEVDWTAPPRPISECFAKFSFPQSISSWESRSKCNLYYYRTNYFILLAAILEIAFLRNPLALFSVVMAAICLALLNDSFAVTVNQKLMRGVRRLSPHLAAKMRPPAMPMIRGKPASKRAVYICGQRRNLVVIVLSIATCWMWYITSALLTVCGGLAIALGCILLHASLRMPNLKARLSTVKEEFRAVWKRYGEF